MEQHHTEIHTGRVRDFAVTEQPDAWRPVYQATCSCGYVGPAMTNKRAALDDADEHVLTITRAE